MRLLSVNVGRECPIENAKRSGVTGIFKRPVPGPVEVGPDGLEGDTVSDRENHGGPDQAVYVFGGPDYEWWSEELDRDLGPGTFGENLTVSGLEPSRLSVGDRLLVGGEVLLEVTVPRIPCVTLAARMGDRSFLRRFRRAERPGVYCRVLREGSVEAGDAVLLRRYAGEGVAVVELFRDFFEPEVSEERLRRHLAAPIAERARAEKERQLEGTVRSGAPVRGQEGI